MKFYNNVEAAFYQCPFGRSSKTNARLCQVYERSVTFEDDDKVVKGSVEEEESSGKDVEVFMKVIPMPRPPPPSLSD